MGSDMVGPDVVGTDVTDPGFPGQPRPPTLAALAGTVLCAREVSIPSGQPRPAPGTALRAAADGLAVPGG
ncbi:MAG TPA: hypothetical protein VE888_05620 [Streptosporangiaceae bacterium]|nr:hypothetical protein [Streptosporangiaceae bacterium]